MNFIDIASWQKGIDLAALFAQNELDGVIVKATEGTGYVNPEFKGWADWLRANNKPMGVYHYCIGDDPTAEAEYFYNAIKDYLGCFVPCADYESPATDKGTVWLKQFLDAFQSLTGIKCLVYASLYVVRSQDFSAIAADGYKLWLAQYADMNPTGFVEHPWQDGSVAPFRGFVMQQYSSNGQLNSWNGNLDLDLFYGTSDDWKALCGKTEQPPETLKPADPVIVAAVLANEYGTGKDRSAKLRAAGYDPESVQKKINELYGVALSCKKKCEGNMEYINSIVKIMRLL